MALCFAAASLRVQTRRLPSNSKLACSSCGRVVLQGQANRGWAEAHEKIARMTLTIKLDRNWSSFQLANSAPPLSVTDSAIAPSARMNHHEVASVVDDAGCGSRCPMGRCRYAHGLSYMPCLALVCVCVTPKGVLPPTLCHASATHESA